MMQGKIRIFLYSLFTLIPGHGFAQQEMCVPGFFHYLYLEKEYDEILRLASGCEEQKAYINYYEVVSLYQLQRTDSLLIKADPVTSGEYYNRIRIISNQAKLAAGNTGISYPEINSDTLEFEILHLQYLASLLMKKNLEEFFMIYSEKRCTREELLALEFNLYMYYNELLHIPHKRKGIAAILSTLVPGLGKVYAGKPLEGFMSFSPVAANAVQAWEGYRKKGIESLHL